MIRFLHVLAAAYWVGGNLLFFLTLRTARPADRQILYRSLGGTFRITSWLALGFLFLTGFVLLPGFSAELYRTKFFLVGLAVVLKGLHDFQVAPRARRTGKRLPVLVLAYTLLILEIWIVYEAVSV